jgi:hypothetical protein
MEKVMTPQNRGVKNSTKQTIKSYKADSQSPKKFFICCFVVIRVQKQFVGLKAVL